MNPNLLLFGKDYIPNINRYAPGNIASCVVIVLQAYI